ncbi:MAG: AAA family ATPase, partial [Bacilli bacterium]|nr:AAA family ATPase [Bacilli bacterium]
YIPGEINFPDVKSGTVFLHEYGTSLGAEEENFQYADQIIQRMQLDIRAYPKRMSKGMKQKTAIVAALMLKAPILIMDEPTTGLDPLMREEFLELVLEQKKRGASIIMTSNTIEELERVCDKVALLSQGKIVDVVSMEDMRNRFFRDYKIEFIKEDDYLSFLKGRNDIQQVKPELLQVTLRVAKEEVPMLMRRLSLYQVKYLSEKKFTLSDYFTEKRRQQKGE